MKALDKIAKFLEGFGSVLSLVPPENTRKITPLTSSIKESLNNDWQVIGKDMWKGFRLVEAEELEIRHNSHDNGSVETDTEK